MCGKGTYKYIDKESHILAPKISAVTKKVSKGMISAHSRVLWLDFGAVILSWLVLFSGLCTCEPGN